MENFAILVDTTSELSRNVRNDFDIELLRAHFKDKDGKDKLSFTDWDECDYYKNSEEFFAELKANHDKFSTAPLSIPELCDAFEAKAKEGRNIIAFTISSAMSGTYTFFNTAKEQIEAKYPEIKIYIVDSMRFGASIGLMAIKAAELRNQGLSAGEVFEQIEANKSRFHQMGWLDDLKFVAQTGRITQSKAFFGQLIGIKPLGECDSNGLTTVLGKAKGEKSAFAAMIDYIDQIIEKPEEQVILICQSNHAKEAEKYKNLIQEKFSPKAIYVLECGPSCGVHIGPGLLSAYFMGKPLSEGLETEKKIMEEILLKSKK